MIYDGYCTFGGCTNCPTGSNKDILSHGKKQYIKMKHSIKDQDTHRKH